MTEHQRELNNAIAHELDMADRSCAPLRAEHIRFAMLVVTLAVVGLAYAYQAAKSLGWV